MLHLILESKLDDYSRAIEAKSAQLPTEERAQVAAKIARARELLSKSDPVKEFFAWVPPDIGDVDN